MGLYQFNEEVFFAKDKIVEISRRDMEFLKEKAAKNIRKRARICLHKNVQDELHEMLIAHMEDAYIRPHRHLGKSESLYVIEGSADAVMFDEKGGISEVIRLGDYDSGKKFYYRISTPAYHTLIIGSKYFIFHEVTGGPFNRADTVFAGWSPEENDFGAAAKFTKKLAERIRSL